MSLKSKIVGIVAGATITLSLVTGAYAQQTSSTVTLTTKTGGSCTVAGVHGSFDFGTWQWDGSKYVLSGGSGVAQVNVDVKQDLSPQNVDCTITVNTGDLRNGNSVISAGSLSPKVNGQGQTAKVSTPAGEGAKNVPVQITMSNLGTSLSAGTYTGNVTISVASGS
jgi:hypothetical protein